MQHLGDISHIDGSAIPAVDAVIGGSPCQDLSVAGKRAGMNGERSGLFMEQIRIIKEMRIASENQRPRFMLWENVPGAFSSSRGEDFRAVLEETAKICQPDAVIPKPEDDKWRTSGCVLGNGWSIAWRICNAQFWGVPQRRRRVALIADFGGKAAPEILFERQGLSGDIEPGAAPRQTFASGTRAGASAAGFLPNAGAKANGVAYEQEVAPTLSSQQKAAVCYSINVYNQTYRTLDAVKCGSSSCNQGRAAIVKTDYKTFDCRGNGNGFISNTLTGDHQNRITDYTSIVSNGKVVRRLTPLECERLQGYPDGWTDIGAWRDSKGKLHKESSDTARYRALGNSIALPPWRWILRRMAAWLEKPCTMGSLFDGIGGFPLLWEEINGTGTCLWTSEIDEFCIAVTKHRFNYGG